MRIQVDQFVVLIANEVERVPRSATDHANARVQRQQGCQTWCINGIQLIGAEPQGY